MKPTKLSNLVVLAIGTTIVVYGALWLLDSRGFYLSPVSYLVALVEALLAAAVLAAGWSVRSYLRGERPGLSGVRAARYVLLGKAASHAGTLLFSIYAAQVLLTLGQLQFEPQRARAWSAAAAALAAIALVAAGYFTERWGTLPPSDRGTEQLGDSDEPNRPSVSGA